jgi:hypothetical protein
MIEAQDYLLLCNCDNNKRQFESREKSIEGCNEFSSQIRGYCVVYPFGKRIKRLWMKTCVVAELCLHSETIHNAGKVKKSSRVV